MSNKINVDKVYLINLERRQDRLSHFLGECKREDIDMTNVKIFKALDAKTYELKKNEEDMFDKSIFDLKFAYSKPCMCNQLSHYYIISDMIKNKYKKCIIFQDDVRLKNNFSKEVNNVISNMPKDSEIVWIGLHKQAYGSHFEDYPINDNIEEKDRYYVKEKVNNYICKYTDKINPCSLGYIITYNGAKNYLNYLKKIKIKYATDHMFNEYLWNKGIMYGSYDVLCTGNSKFKSDVFEVDDGAIERDMLELLGC